jgi:integrase
LAVGSRRDNGPMAAKLETTKTPGIFRRHAKNCGRQGRCDCSYVILFRHRGRQHTETFRTFAEAREAKRTRGSQVARGDFSALSRIALHDYAREWIDRYQGTGRRGFREETREEYRTLLNRYSLRFFSAGTRLSEIDPRQVADLIGWLVTQPNGKGGTLSDKSVRNALGPLTACLATARREGLMAHNPATGAALPHRPRVEEDDERPRPFPRIEVEGGPVETMELVVSLIHPAHRLMFELLAATGVRRSELLAIEGRHLALDGAHPHVKVRQRAVRRTGHGMVVGPLKSRHARRDLPLPLALADRLRALRTSPDGLVFASPGGSPYDTHHLHQRVLAPACSEAGVEWAGFHTFRHTVASRMFAAGRNVVQVQRWLGHHAASFTLDTYVYLLSDELPAPLEPAVQVNSGSTQRPKTAASEQAAGVLKAA